MTENNLLYTLALQHVRNIGDITAKKLISHCGSAEAVLKEKKQNLLKIDGIGSVILGDLFETNHLKSAEKEVEFIKENNLKVLYFKGEKVYEEVNDSFEYKIIEAPHRNYLMIQR